MRSFKKMISALMIVALLTSQIASASAETIVLPGQLQTIGTSAFAGDKSLITVEVPYGTKRIESKAFADSSLLIIGIPSTVEYIADDAFLNTNVTIRADEDTYAYNYALEHGFEIENNMTEEEALLTLQELAESDLSEEDFVLAEMELISTDGITDENVLKDLEEINQMIEEANALAAASNAYYEQMQSELDGLVSSVSGLKESRSGSHISVSYSSMSMLIDEEIERASENGAEILSSDYSDDDGIVYLAVSNGEEWYMYTEGDSVYLTVNPPYTVTNASAVSDRAVANSSNGGFIQSVNDNLSKIQTGFTALSGFVDLDTETTKLLLEVETKSKSKYDKFVNKYAENDSYRIKVAEAKAKSAEQAKKIDSLNKRLSFIRKLSKAITALNIGLVIQSAILSINLWLELNEIESDGHPNEKDKTNEAISVAQKMNGQIKALRTCLKVNVLMQLVSLALTIGTLVSAIPSGGITVAVLFILNTGLALDGVLLEEGQNQLISEIRQMHKQLHTSVYGWVTEERDGKPISDVRISVNDYDFYTDENGYFDFSLLPGTYTFDFSKSSYMDEMETVTLPEGEMTEKKVEMTREEDTVTISGIICASYDLNWGLENVCVACEGWITYTDWYGHYTITCKRGSYITYSKAGFATQTRYVGYEDENWWFDPNIQM